MMRKLSLTSVALGLIAALLAASVTDSRASQGKGSKGLEGSWEVRVTSVSNSIPPFDEFITFTPGGGLVETNNTFPPTAASPGHGAWEYAGGQTYNFTFYKLLFLGPQGQFTGRLRVRGSIVLHGRDEWTGLPATVDFLDPAGNVVLSDQTTATATRIAVLPQ
jgi:hypothetical protein